MVQPTPPGDMPLVEGLGVEWNDIVSAIPEAQRAELAPKLQERISDYENRLKEYEPWDQFRQQNITPQHADTAVNLLSLIESDPKKVYEAIGEHLGMTPTEAKAAVKEMKKEAVASGEDPRLKTLEDQIATLAQIQITERELSVQEQQIAEADAEIEQDLQALRDKYGDIDEDEIVMRMLHLELSPEEAYNHYSSKLGVQRPPAPMVMGQGGSIPSRAVDVTKLNSKSTRDLVAQMMSHGNAERKA